MENNINNLHEQEAFEEQNLGVRSGLMEAETRASIPKVETYLPTTTPEDKDFLDSPFAYNFKDFETVSLNTGSYSYEVTDFVLPGKNGLDLVVKRNYCSQRANTEDFTFAANPDTSLRYYGVYIKYDTIYGGGMGSDITYRMLETGGPYIGSSPATTAKNDAIAYWKDWEFDGKNSVVTTYPDGTRETATMNGSVESVSALSSYRYSTSTRDNRSFVDKHKLGFGWRFNFPCIESLPDSFHKASGIRYKDYLHLDDGRTFKIDQKSGGAKFLEDHELKDFTFSASSGSLSFTDPENKKYTLSYVYIVTFKDGKTYYLDNSNTVAIKDRFGNGIYFVYSASGITVFDSWNRKITLGTDTTAPYNWKWTLPDDKTIRYSVVNDQLKAVCDQVGRVTSFTYENGSASAMLFFDYSGDSSKSITYRLLKEITHPTGAKSKYTYQLLTESSSGDGGSRYRQYYALKTREDEEVLGASTVISNKLTYSFSKPTAVVIPKESSKDLHIESNYRYYIATATVTDSNRGIVETHSFNNKHLRSSEVITRSGGSTLSRKDFVYGTSTTANNYKLLISETAKLYNASGQYIQSVTKWEYDAAKKANVTKLTDPMNFVTDMTYDANYSQLLTKSFKKDASTTILEQNTLRADGKAIEWAKVLVNGVAKSAVKFVYDSADNIVEEQRYRDPVTLKDYVSTRYAHLSTSTSLPTVKRLVGIVDIDGNPLPDITESFAYDALGRMTSKMDPCGNVSKVDYDALGRVTKEINPDLSFRLKVYDDKANKITLIDENGNQSRTEYTPLGKVSRVLQLGSDTLLKSFDYDTLGRLKTETIYKPSGPENTSSYLYDLWDRVTEKTVRDASGNELAKEETFYNDAFNADLRQVKVTVKGDADAPDTVTTSYYDRLGRIVKKGFYLDGTEYFDTFTYDNLGNKLTAVTALDATRGVTTGKWEYDFASRVTKETNAIGQYALTEYDAIGNKTKATDVVGREAVFRYDVAGRLLEQISPFDKEVKTSVRFQYDACGRVTGQYYPDENLARTDHEYDTRGRLVRTKSWKSSTENDVVTFSYDNVGNKLSVTTGGNSTIQYVYNAFNTVTEQTDALGQVEHFHYDTTGRLLSKTDRNGLETIYTYDALGRILSEKAGEDFVSCVYTKTGQKKREENAELTVDFRYDELGRIKSQTETGGIVKTYSYDLTGNRTAFTLVKDGVNELVTNYAYDNLNRLFEVQEKGSVIANYTYDMAGNRKSLEYPNGVTTSYAYNDANLVIRLENRRAGSILSAWDYTYRPDGNQLSKRDHTGKVTSYVYDRLGRLVSESEQNGDTIAYEFDSRGNRVLMTVSGGNPAETSYVYDLNNCLLSEQKRAGQVVTTNTYSYDLNGNQTSRQTDIVVPRGKNPKNYIGFNSDLDTVEVIRYNGFNQQVLAHSRGATTTYLYRPDGLRHSKSTEGHMTTHLWDGGNIVAEVGANGVFVRYLRGLNLIAREQQTFGREYYLFNAHGDVIQRTDEQGGVLKKYDYDAFGVEKNPEPMDANPWRYCGEYFERNTGTYYLRNRHYDPLTSRFTSEDPHWNTRNMVYGDNPLRMNERIDQSGQNIYTLLPDINAIQQSGNLYSYCMNNPIQYADSNGKLAFLVVTALAGAIIGGVAGAIYSYATTGSVSWQSVAIGAAAGGLIGLGAGAAAGVLLAGSATATTLAVTTGFSSLATAMSGGGLAAAGTFLAQNLRNSTAGFTVLGHNPGYLELAEKLKARVFTIPTESWNKLTGAQQWSLNQQFLDKSMSMGNEFIFSTNAYSARVGSYLYSEVQYLLANGYRIVDEGWRMIR